MKDQRIRDPIHDLIKFSGKSPIDSVLWDLVQRPEFQRLRRIRQLGFSEFVYPGATHTRFSHAVGAMQMARRMLDVLRKNRQLPETKGNIKENIDEDATLCAALLHDVGHGPLSHVFEEVSKSCGIKIHHEEWTRRIIAESSIASTLSKSSPDLLSKTVRFFASEPGPDIYTRIVSHQLDADRLDFLMRDRYFTGVKFGSIDIEWLLDCLDVQEVEIEPQVKKLNFVVQAKGISSVENFLYAYAELYSKVYFHKTTRAVQIMMEDILRIAAKDPSILPEKSPFRKYFESAPTPTLEDYLKLDDYEVWSVVQYLAARDHGEASLVSRRLLNRELYKCFEPPRDPKETLPPPRLTRFEVGMESANLWFKRDRLTPKGYKEFDVENDKYMNNILVYSEVHRAPVAVHELNEGVKKMAGGKPARYYFKDDASRQQAKNIWVATQ
jgi:HD superfamily phosphohydrolase